MHPVPDIGVTVRSLNVTTVLKKCSTSKIARRWFGRMTGETVPSTNVRHGVHELLKLLLLNERYYPTLYIQDDVASPNAYFDNSL